MVHKNRVQDENHDLSTMYARQGQGVTYMYLYECTVFETFIYVTALELTSYLCQYQGQKTEGGI